MNGRGEILPGNFPSQSMQAQPSCDVMAQPQNPQLMDFESELYLQSEMGTQESSQGRCVRCDPAETSLPQRIGKDEHAWSLETGSKLVCVTNNWSYLYHGGYLRPRGY